MDETDMQAEALARAICAADGRDPDAPAPAEADPGAPAAEVPQWRRYEAQARRIIAAQLAL